MTGVNKTGLSLRQRALLGSRGGLEGRQKLHRAFQQGDSGSPVKESGKLGGATVTEGGRQEANQDRLQDPLSTLRLLRRVPL